MNSIKSATVLMIDDDINNLVIMEAFLGKLCQKITLQSNPLLGLQLAQEKQPDVILLDIRMRELDGYETCQRLKSNPETAAIPVIFLSSLTRASDKVKGFEVGAVDYISKPFEIEEVIARIENCLRLQQQINHRVTITAKQQEDKIHQYQLSHSETQILRLYTQGYQRKEIGTQLFISKNTVKTHLKSLFIKLDIKNRTEAITKAREIGLVE